ncbi:apoptotic chromatin condensation inducer in the nucleus isoform X2 [Prorops nasuta]|uniref:apoptotic chromatin condensation inducer in the nucleus isoform X2 n=1 Tax=Prorops nasuta TaxID=863751 RepID=UPI0034CDCCD5
MSGLQRRDQQGDTNEASCSIQNIDSESSKPNNTTDPTSNSNGDYAATSEEITSIIIKEEPIVEPSTTEEKPIKVEETKKEEIAPKEIKREDSSDDNENEEAEPKIQKITKISQSESSSESQDEARTKSSPTTVRTTSRSARRKPRDKYRDSSNSESQDSEDEASIESKIDKSVIQKNQSDVEASQEEKEPSGSPDHNANTVLDDAGIDTETCESTREKPDTSIKKLEPIVSSIQSTNNKPAKVSLKRSFASRIAEKSESKLDNPEGSNNAESINQNQESYSNGNEEQKCIPRKRRWGITSLSTDTAPSFSISTDSLKELVPGAKPLPINEVRLSKDDDEEKETHNDIEKWHSINSSTGETVNKDENTQKNGTAKKGDGKTDNHLGTRRKISIVKDTPHLKSPSPPASTPTNILLIKNLVRPFTLNQIKELLTRTGTIVENGFWMDRIKSKCFVEYTNEDQAFETRQALHGISWPVSNPKRLLVEYATKEDMEMARELSKDQPILRKTEPLVSTDIWQHDWGRDEKTNVAKVTVVREWDLGKEENQQHVKEKEREKKEDKKRRLRSRSPAMEAHLPAPARKFKKKEDDPPPAKLLDDLFRKTKATPCIYWLPLTNEQIVVKEEMRRQHMAEHARRLEEMRRAERNRDGRRRRSPRK